MVRGTYGEGWLEREEGDGWFMKVSKACSGLLRSPSLVLLAVRAPHFAMRNCEKWGVRVFAERRGSRETGTR